MSPPPWSSFPETGLNFTSIDPSSNRTRSVQQMLNVPPESWLVLLSASTFGALGAPLSSATSQVATGPFWFVPSAFQPSGSLPLASLSKLMAVSFAGSAGFAGWGDGEGVLGCAIAAHTSV